MAGWHGVDLDGTLAHYPPPPGKEIGDPIPRMLARVKRWLANGEEVRIVTARVAYSGGEPLGDAVRTLEFCLRQRELIEAWCLKHVGVVLPVGANKDYSMIDLWDDRAVQVIVNTGERVDGAD